MLFIIIVDSRYLELAYLEVKIWSLPKHETLTTGKKIVEKRRNCSFSPIFSVYLELQESSYIYNVFVFVKCGCLNYFFLNSANLICRGMDILKYFREFLGIRDNESRLYIHLYTAETTKPF